ncbi:MAG: DNA pilot protein [Microviridae sp.]|nr:MAG: DNA pilot protein [Microviridae sp.]
MGFFKTFGEGLANVATGGISGLVSTGLGLMLQKNNDQRQLAQQEKLNELQIKGQKTMVDYNYGKELQMWKDTSYNAQKEQMKKAGLNPALMYGMGGGGGQTTGSPQGTVAGGMAPAGGREIQDSIGMGMQLALLDAQRKNIEADTRNKQMDTTLKNQQQWNLGLDAALKDMLQSSREDGTDINDTGENKFWESVAYKKMVAELGLETAKGKYTIDENKRQDLLNDKVLQELSEKIDLMKKQNLTQEQITENLKRDITLKDAEIKWNEYGLTKQSFSEFLMHLLKRIIK